jgi:hypothetical protein
MKISKIFATLALIISLATCNLLPVSAEDFLNFEESDSDVMFDSSEDFIDFEESNEAISSYTMNELFDFEKSDSFMLPESAEKFFKLNPTITRGSNFSRYANSFNGWWSGEITGLFPPYGGGARLWNITYIDNTSSSTFLYAQVSVVYYSSGASVGSDVDQGYGKPHAAPWGVHVNPGTYTIYGSHYYYNGSYNDSEYTSGIGWIIP